MKIDSLKINVLDILKHHLKESEENSVQEVNDIGDFRFISINDEVLMSLNFDEKCEVNDTTGADLIPKIENYLVPTMEI